MEQTVNSELISIGTEILLGEITDTNSVYLARVLRDYGVNVFYMTSVGDNHGRIVETLRTAMGRSQVVITCGGLGPTVDDMTRQAVAEAVGQPLVYREALMAQIEARFASFRVRMSENNKRQAYLPENAIAIENAVGTAPAFITPYEGGVII
ncbi:MAG: competence/damage-inducible protein A, partial [Anaerolineae bacterium]|nr:competence/damage-inducible protein A [Anaerolineae bacterium]